MLNEVLENIKSRRSVRTYTEQQVSAENLNPLIPQHFDLILFISS